MKRKICQDYNECTPLDWVMYEFATIEYDYQIHPIASRRVEELFNRLFKKGSK